MSISTEITRLETAKADIKSAIEDKGVTVGDGTIDTYAEKIGEISGGEGDYEQGYEDGKNSVVQISKLAVNFTGWFRDTEYPQNTEIVTEYGEYFKGDMSNFCRYSKGINSVTIIGNKDITLSAAGAFQGATDLEFVDMSKCSTALSKGGNMFNGAIKLKTIKGDLNFMMVSDTIDATFNRCIVLEDISFVADSILQNIDFSSSPLLSDETIQSIIDGLADLTGGTAQTITFHATVGDKLTDEQKATISAKNWELVY